MNKNPIAQKRESDNEHSLIDVLIIFSIPMCTPVGVLLLWLFGTWKTRTKLLLTGFVFVIYSFFGLFILVLILKPVEFSVKPLPGITFNPEIIISGSAPNQSKITINGKSIEVFESKFSDVVPLHMGRNEIKIVCASPSRSNEATTVGIERITKAPGPDGKAAKVFCHQKLIERHNYSYGVFMQNPEANISKETYNDSRFLEYKVSGSLTEKTYSNRMMIEYPQPYECIVFYDRLKDEWFLEPELKAIKLTE